VAEAAIVIRTTRQARHATYQTLHLLRWQLQLLLLLHLRPYIYGQQLSVENWRLNTSDVCHQMAVPLAIAKEILASRRWQLPLASRQMLGTLSSWKPPWPQQRRTIINLSWLIGFKFMDLYLIFMSSTRAVCLAISPVCRPRGPGHKAMWLYGCFSTQSDPMRSDRRCLGMLQTT